MLRHSLAVAAVDARILTRDPSPTLVMTVLPLLFVPFLAPGAQAQLVEAGYVGVSGAQYAVPGLAVLFSLLCVQQVLTALFRDRQWGTWDRLRASPATTVDLLVGKSLTAFGAQVAQLAAVLAGGALIYGYRPTGSLVALGAVLLAFAAAMIAFGLLMAAVSRELDHAMVLGNLTAMAMAGIGGAFGPVAALPSWMQAAAPASPAYWAMSAMQSVTLDGAGLAEVLLPLAALAAFTVGFTAIAAATLAARGTMGRPS